MGPFFFLLSSHSLIELVIIKTWVWENKKKKVETHDAVYSSVYLKPVQDVLWDLFLKMPGIWLLQSGEMHGVRCCLELIKRKLSVGGYEWSADPYTLEIDVVHTIQHITCSLQGLFSFKKRQKKWCQWAFKKRETWPFWVCSHSFLDQKSAPVLILKSSKACHLSWMCTNINWPEGKSKKAELLTCFPWLFMSFSLQYLRD